MSKRFLLVSLLALAQVSVAVESQTLTSGVSNALSTGVAGVMARIGSFVISGKDKVVEGVKSARDAAKAGYEVTKAQYQKEGALSTVKSVGTTALDKTTAAFKWAGNGLKDGGKSAWNAASTRTGQVYASAKANPKTTAAVVVGTALIAVATKLAYDYCKTHNVKAQFKGAVSTLKNAAKSLVK